MKWFRSAAEWLADEEQRTGIATTVRFDRSTMMWRGEVEGMSGYVEGVTQHEAQKALLSLLMTAPTVHEARHNERRLTVKLEVEITFAENVTGDQIVDTANDLVKSMENAAESIADDLTARGHVVEVEWAVSPRPTKDRDELIRDVERELNP